jgi:hypothetical protein
LSYLATCLTTLAEYLVGDIPLRSRQQESAYGTLDSAA